LRKLDAELEIEKRRPRKGKEQPPPAEKETARLSRGRKSCLHSFKEREEEPSTMNLIKIDRL
jgi:hypothetical protein